MPPDPNHKPNKSEDYSRGCCCYLTLLRGKAGWVLGILILVTVVALMLQAIRVNRASTQAPVPFTASATSNSAVDRSSLGNNSVATNHSPESIVGTSLGKLSELNSLAREMNAVFVFVPAKGLAPTASDLAAINGAKHSLETRFDIKIGLFTLLPGSRDYDEMAAQMSLPGVMPIVKTGARRAISGELTEDKIVEAFMVAVALGGCCPLGDPPDSR